jgi:hypothetical protein
VVKSILPIAGLFWVLGEIEELEVDVIRQCSAASEAKPYKIPARYIGDKESSRSKRVLNISAGAVRPTQEWGDLYSFGIYGDISYTIFAKRNRIPLGVGPQGGVIVLRRKEDDDFIGSNLAIIPLGGTIKYVIFGKNLKDRLVVDLGAGLAVSILNINHDSENSVDFYSRGSLNLMFNLWKNNQLSLTAGLFSVAYDETPLNAIFGEIGFRSNFF